jgi:exopolyphosphatase/guanosine-5'-triphosphate,3'-diphosphate pyrophosphatase
MRLAIIDLGTNSIRFDIHEVSASRKGTILHRRLYREKAMVRLGQDLFLQGKLSEESKRRTLESIQSFRQTMEALRVDKTVAFGTAAMRDASDGEQFLADIKNETEIDFRIISGAEEAALIAKGVLTNEGATPKGIYALIDIGGGSTEVSICKGKKVLRAASFNLGVAKLQQVFLKTQPPVKASKKSPDPVSELRNFIKSIVLPKMVIERWPKVNQIIGSSGSIIALSKLAHKDKDDVSKKPFPRKELSKIVAGMKTKTTAELLSMRGMEPKRVDLILAGGVLLDELAMLLSAKDVRATEFSLRDGILVDALEQFNLRKNKSAALPLAEIEKRVQAWGMDASHHASVRVQAEWLFDHLKSVHQLKQEWRPYLSAAAILHDVGEIISHAHHAEHSEYIIKNANFVGVHVWEAALIAYLCRFHKEEKILEKKNEKKIPYDKKDELRAVFLKLLALLQMADSLDRTHKGLLKLKKAKIARGQVQLKFSSKHTCDLERLRFEQKKFLFQQVFQREISLSK